MHAFTICNHLKSTQRSVYDANKQFLWLPVISPFVATTLEALEDAGPEEARGGSRQLPWSDGLGWCGRVDRLIHHMLEGYLCSFYIQVEAEHKI